ncbi:putative dna mismatch repair protein msh-2 protein [Botrytis fragariae]|uniref:Putative dna mismatch repair protein msh-2 protein n=1 Tax=Botrytis fragariae TaxID=1964551 RepID=A0A8H6ELN5_9HELO|nr:putative dna mismatch repair protein msh-2 protein [Botrytis fragariae]KAF5876827.1 putative dna mismatch repair protein msh-2 protein [Botrytis fragariae]
MPSAVKKRKVAAPSSRSAATTKIQPLTSFTTISKAITKGGAKSILEKNRQANVASVSVTKLDKPSTNLRKRKLDAEEESNVEIATTTTATATTAKEIETLPSKLVLPSKVPQTPHKLIKTSSITTDTPTKGARTLLDRLLLQTPKRPVQKRPSLSSLRSISSNCSTEVSTLPLEHSQIDAEGKEEASQQDDLKEPLPTELIDIINLHAALLTTLTLHCAHNGSNAPADLRNLCPDVARAWGKRKVMLDDISRALGVLNSHVKVDAEDQKISTITLSDYGSGKICVEIEAGNGGEKGNNLRPIDEERLNEIFSQRLISQWELKEENVAIEDFIKQLPSEPITPCSSLSKMTPLLAKGQRRLEDMKAGIVAKKDLRRTKSSPALIQAATSTDTSSPPSTEKKPTLLERLRAKQLKQSLLPQAPSPAQVARKSALSRMEEVVKVLSILSTSGSAGQQRISFTMPTLIGKLKDSFKTPISKDEAITVVKLLAVEIAPEWVQLARIGKMEAVVFDREKKILEENVKDRVKKAQAA